MRTAEEHSADSSREWGIVLLLSSEETMTEEKGHSRQFRQSWLVSMAMPHFEELPWIFPSYLVLTIFPLPKSKNSHDLTVMRSHRDMTKSKELSEIKCRDTCEKPPSNTQYIIRSLFTPSLFNSVHSHLRWCMQLALYATKIIQHTIIISETWTNKSQ